jgi:hypothetical protein
LVTSQSLFPAFLARLPLSGIFFTSSISVLD